MKYIRLKQSIFHQFLFDKPGRELPVYGILEIVLRIYDVSAFDARHPGTEAGLFVLSKISTNVQKRYIAMRTGAEQNYCC